MRKLLLAATALALSAPVAFADVKVGMITTLSGGGAGLGIDVRDGFMLAIQQSGRDDIEVVIEDDQRKPDIAVQLADKMIQSEKVDVLTGPHAGSYDGAASMGVRPMFGENLPNLESYIFDFQGDIYGEHVSVALIEYLRPEAKFDSLDALIAQMDADCDKARQILSAL